MINNNVPDIIQAIINKYPNLVLPHTHIDSKYHGVYHTGRHVPTFAKVRKLSQEKTEAACKEFKKLQANGIISPSKSPLNVFYKIGLMSAYHQIKMYPDDIDKTAILSPFGLHEYNFIPFGLKNAAATFQHLWTKYFRI